MGLLDQFSEFAKTPEGQGLLSAAFGGLAGAQRGAPLNSIGRAGMAGLAGYSGALDRQQSQADNAFNQQYRSMQMDELKRKQAEAAAQQQWRQGLPDVLKQSQTTYGAGDEGPTMTPGNPDALKGYLMRPDSPFLDEMLKQQMFPTPDDYKVVGSDLVKIGKGGVTVAHQSQRPDNLTSDQKQYNLAVDQGFKGTFMDFLRERVNTTEGAKAGLDLVEITTPDGKAYKVPRSRAVGMAGGSTPSPRPNGYAGGSAAAAATDQVAIISKELENARAAGRTQDVLALENELGRLNRNAPGLQVQSESEKAAAVARAKADAEAASGVEAKKAEERKRFAMTSANNVIGAIDEATKLIGYNSAGLMSGLSSIGGTDARNLASKLETIKANLGFDRLQQMRDMSPTGGALGSVAVQELTALQSTVSSLDQSQSPAQLRASLSKIKKHYDGWRDAVVKAGGSGEQATPQGKTVVRRGLYNGRKVVQYSDGSTEYAD